MWSHLNVCKGQLWNGSTLLFVHLSPPHAPAVHATGRDWYRAGTLWGMNRRLAEWLKRWPPGAWHGTIPAPGRCRRSCYLTPSYHSEFAAEQNLSIAGVVAVSVDTTISGYRLLQRLAGRARLRKPFYGAGGNSAPSLASSGDGRNQSPLKELDGTQRARASVV